MSDAHTLSPGEVIRTYLDGCADFDTGFDENKLISLLRDHGYIILTKKSVEDYKSEIARLEARHD